MYRIRQIWVVAAVNFKGWKKNPQIILAFCLSFIMCFLLSDKVITFAAGHNTVLQAAEPFIWTFGDSTSVLLSSLTLLLLFSDMPSLGNEVPFFLLRTDRKTWLLGQMVYIVSVTFIFMCWIFLSTVILSAGMAYPANMWSDTAAVLGYSNIGSEISVPSFVKVMELSFPYGTAINIFGLMLGYSLVLAGIMLLFNMVKAGGGMVAAIIFSGLGFLLTPDVISEWLNIPQENIRYANIIFGWISPLNHATYYMHNFGYDNLPRLWTSYVFFVVIAAALFALSMLRIRKYSFNFTGTEKG